MGASDASSPLECQLFLRSFVYLLRGWLEASHEHTVPEQKHAAAYRPNMIHGRVALVPFPAVPFPLPLSRFPVSPPSLEVAHFSWRADVR